MRAKTGTKRRFSFTCGVLCAAFLLCAIPARAQIRHTWWYTLEQGKQSFRNGAYGEALMRFEDARRQRRAMYEQMERDLIDLLSMPQVRRLGDSLERVDAFARDRHYDRATAVLDEAYYRYPKTVFNDSASAVLEALGRLKNYPEAEYWIGETYRLEGELTLAVSQFQKAWEQRDMLELDGFDAELLYKIAGLRKLRQEYNEMERTLLLILAGDRLWSMGEGTVSVANSQDDAIKTFARNAMARTLENDGIDRFLTLYRYINTPSEQAHRLLGFYYYASGRYIVKAQDHLMFAFLIQNSVIIEELIRNEYDFVFSSLETLSDRVKTYPLIMEYVDKSDYHKTAYYLACSLYGNGKTAAARGLWSFLSSRAPPGEWQNRAALQLRQPRIERVIEMP